MMFEPWRKYATFSGRARRREYWLWQLFLVLLFGALNYWLYATLTPAEVVSTPFEFSELKVSTTASMVPATIIVIAAIALFLPSLAVSVRRLHDSDKSGWWLLLGLTGIGGFVLLIFYLLDGTPARNAFGPDPKGRERY